MFSRVGWDGNAPYFVKPLHKYIDITRKTNPMFSMIWWRNAVSEWNEIFICEYVVSCEKSQDEIEMSDLVTISVRCIDEYLVRDQYFGDIWEIIWNVNFPKVVIIIHHFKQFWYNLTMRSLCKLHFTTKVAKSDNIVYMLSLHHRIKHVCLSKNVLAGMVWLVGFLTSSSTY